MKKLLIASLLLSVAVYLMFSAFATDIVINKYSDIEAVNDQKAIESGWIPKILPVGAYSIVETHDGDSHEVFGEFKCPENGMAEFMKNLKPYRDMNDTLQWQNFLFKIDSKEHKIKFRTIP